MNPLARSQQETAFPVDSKSAQPVLWINIIRGLLDLSVRTLIREVVFLQMLDAPGQRACMDQPTLGRIAGRGARHRPRLCQKSNGH